MSTPLSYTRSFAFLQGIRSPFFGRLALYLKTKAANTVKVNFTAGDEVFWPRSLSSVAFRGEHEQLDPFYQDFFTRHAITDIVLFGDSRIIHTTAIAVARQMGLRVHVFEEGYFRPYWLTLDSGGVNANSSLPRDPDWYKEVAKFVPRYGNGQAFKSSFITRAWHDVAYNLHGLRDRWQYPGYQTHAPYSVWTEYAAYIRRGWKLRGRTRQDAQSISHLIRHDQRFYLLALQLNSDTQIRQHSGFDSMNDVIDLVLRSFAEFAPADAILVIKNHPLDPGIDDHEGTVAALARQLGIAERVIFLESGHLPSLLSHTVGVIVVNSTVGGSALVHAAPTISLGKALYDLPGLTFQGDLDAFWRDAEPPDMRLFRNFRNVVIHTTQINGGFYTRSGISMALEGCAGRLLSDRLPLEMLGR